MISQNKTCQKKEKKKLAGLTIIFCHGSMLNNAILTTSMRQCNKINGVFHQCCITLLILQWAICSFSYCAITSLPRYHILYFDTFQGLEIFEIQTTCQSLFIAQRYGPCQKVMF